jgi:hypothetical protein
MVPGLSPNALGSAKELVYGLSEMIHSPGLKTVSIPVPTSRPTGVTPANAKVQVDLNLLGLYAVQTGARLAKSGALLIEVSKLSEDISLGDSIMQLDETDPSSNTIEVDFPAPREDQVWVVVAIYARGTAQVSDSRAKKPAARRSTNTSFP